MSRAFDPSVSAQYILGGDDASVDITAASWTLVCWFKLNDIGSEHQLVTKWSAGGQQYILTVSGGNLIGAINTGSFFGCFGSTALFTGVWYHAVLRQNGTALELFLNGVSEATATTDGNGPQNTSLPLKLGAGGDASTHENPHNGLLSRVAIWNSTALNSTQITNLQTQDPDVAAPTGLTFYAIETANEIVDYAGGITLTNHGSTYSSDEPFSTGAQTITLSSIPSVAQSYAPALTPGTVAIALSTIASVAQSYAPTLAPGAVTLDLPAIAAGSQAFPPSLAQQDTLILPAIPPASQAFAPTLTPGPVTVALSSIASTAQVFPPSFLSVQSLGLPLIPSAAQTFAPTLTLGPAPALPPGNFADFLAANSRELIILAEITPSLSVSGWTSEAPALPNTYSAPIARAIQEDLFAGGVYRQVVGVRVDATDLSSVGSAAACAGAPGSWYWDASTEAIYVHTGTGASPDTFVAVQVFVTVYTATTGLVLNATDGDANSGRYYWPWLTGDLPSLSQQVDDLLFGIKSAPSGSITLTNGHGFWNRIVAQGSGWNWKNKRVRFFAGGRYNGLELPRSQYAAVMTMLVDDITADDERCTLALKPLVRQLDLELPRTPFFESEYPNLGEGVRGAKKWIGYGRATIPPDLTDTTVSSGRWTIADAAYQTLYAVHGVYAVNKTTGVRTQLSAGSQYSADLTACTVTILDAAYVHTTHSIEVDVTGKHAAGVPIVLFGSIVKDLLKTFVGVTDNDLDLPAFAQADHDAPGELSVWLKSPRALTSILGSSDRDLPSLERSVLGTVQQTLAGAWTCWVWDPGYDPGNIVHLRKEDLALFTPEPKLETIYSTTRVFFAKNHARDEWAVEAWDDPPLKYVAEIDEAAELYTFLADASHARIMAQRYQLLSGAVSLEIEIKERGALLALASAGDKVLVTFSPAPSTTGAFESQPFEVVRIDKAYAPTLVISGRISDLRGVGRTIGHWTDSSAPPWLTATDAQKATQGFWSDANGLIDPADNSTKNRSRWW